MGLTRCTDCGKEVSTDARVCFGCGRRWPGTPPVFRLIGVIVFIIIAIAAFSVFLKAGRGLGPHF